MIKVEKFESSIKLTCDTCKSHGKTSERMKDVICYFDKSHDVPFIDIWCEECARGYTYEKDKGFTEYTDVTLDAMVNSIDDIEKDLRDKGIIQ